MKKMQKNRKVILIALIGVVLAVLVSVLIFSIYKKLTTLTIEEEEMYQYFSGVRFDYDGKVNFKYDGEIVKIDYGDKEVEADSTPIYFKNSNHEVLLPKSMELVMPRMRNNLYRTNFFAKISISLDGGQTTAAIGDGKKEYYFENGFLYDGKNLYVFPYGADVTVNGVTHKLSMLSYAIVNYRGDVELYDCQSDTYEIIDSTEGDVVAKIGDYQANLSTDTLIYSDATRLLPHNFGKLLLYEGEDVK